MNLSNQPNDRSRSNDPQRQVEQATKAFILNYFVENSEELIEPLMGFLHSNAGLAESLPIELEANLSISNALIESEKKYHSLIAQFSKLEQVVGSVKKQPEVANELFNGQFCKLLSDCKEYVQFADTLFLELIAAKRGGLLDTGVTEVNIDQKGVRSSNSNSRNQEVENLENIHNAKRIQTASLLASYCYEPQSKASPVNLLTTLANLNLPCLELAKSAKSAKHPTFSFKPGELEHVLRLVHAEFMEFRRNSSINDNIQFVVDKFSSQPAQLYTRSEYIFWFRLPTTIDQIRLLEMNWTKPSVKFKELEKFLLPKAPHIAKYADNVGFTIIVKLPTHGAAHPLEVSAALSRFNYK